jgi:hypothetical protein
MNAYRSLVEIKSEENGNLAERLIAAVNVSSVDMDGDGLSGRDDETIYLTYLEEHRIFGINNTVDRGSVITKEILSRRWGIIGLDTEHQTLAVTTQRDQKGIAALPFYQCLCLYRYHVRFGEARSWKQVCSSLY